MEILSREKKALQQGCACAVLHGAQKKLLTTSLVGTNLHTNGDVLESLSFDKEILQNQLEVVVIELQKTINKVAKSKTMAKTMGLTLLNLSLDKHILQQKLRSVFVEFQATQSHVANCEDVENDWKSSWYTMLCLELENKWLRSQLGLAKEEIEHLKGMIVDIGDKLQKGKFLPITN